MKKILLVIALLLLFSSCGLVLHGPVEEGHIQTLSEQTSYATLDCIDLFSVNGRVFTHARGVLPMTVYNPNLYTIVITVNGLSFLTLPAHSEERLY